MIAPCGCLSQRSIVEILRSLRITVSSVSVVYDQETLAQSQFGTDHFKPESIDVRKPGKVQPANPPRVVQDGVALDVEQLGSNVSENARMFVNCS